MIIIGQSFLKLKSTPYIFENLKKFLKNKNKISDEWNALNIISNNAATVGSYDLDILSASGSENPTLTKIKENFFDILFLFGQDDLKFNKKDEFIIYVGSHGDKGAEMSDIILPGASYTEQDAHFTNLEGKIQKAYKASYPPGDSKEDWEIINNLSKFLKRKKLFKNKDELVDSMLNYIKLNNKDKNNFSSKHDFFNENIILDPIDYFYSNVIARSSKTMSLCRDEKINIQKTGTEG